MYLLRRLEATHRTATAVRAVLPQVRALGLPLPPTSRLPPPHWPPRARALWFRLMPLSPDRHAQVPEAADVFAAYDLAHASIEQFMHNMHNEWFQTIEPSIAKELQANLLTVDKAQGERLHGAWALDEGLVGSRDQHVVCPSGTAR